VPFGPYIMAHVQRRLTRSGYEGDNVKFAKTPEKAGLGPKTSGEKQKSIKAGRLKGQLFACESVETKKKSADSQIPSRTKVRRR